MADDAPFVPGLSRIAGKPLQVTFAAGRLVYLGEAVHKGIAYPGEHAPIIDQRAWDKAHAVMAEPAH